MIIERIEIDSLPWNSSPWAYLPSWFVIAWSGPYSNIIKSTQLVGDVCILVRYHLTSFASVVGADRIAKNGDTANKVRGALGCLRAIR